MTPNAFAQAALALPGAACTIQWGDERVYKVGGKMFAVTDGEGRRLSLKVSDIAYEVLLESGLARTAPYLARAKWVRFDDLTSLEDDDLQNWLANAHSLVAAKLTRAVRRDLGLA